MRHLGARVLALAVMSGPAMAAPVSTGVAVSGLVGAPATLGAAQLQALPPITQTDSYTAGGTEVTDTFTGPSLWSVLQGQGGIVTNPAVKNDVLQTYSVVIGADGYQAVVSSGEIAPNFGNKPDLLAAGDTGGTLPGSGGVARLTSPGDVAGGRYVSNVASVVVGHGPTAAGTGGGVTPAFRVQGSVATPVSFTLPSLEALPAHRQTVTYKAGSTTVTDTYTGVLLWDVLAQASVVINPAIKNDILRQVVVVTGSDGYSVDIALGEIAPMFGDEPILVAYSDADGQLGPGGADGFARLVVPGDSAGGRYVSNLASVTVFDASVPEPASLALLGGVLVAAGLGRRCVRLLSGTACLGTLPSADWR